MKLCTWNVNSIKARLPNILEWVQANTPDILLLQEIKTINDAFPTLEFEDMGYNCALNGQKTYNGVAILSRYPPEDIITALPGDPEDTQARYIEAVISIPTPEYARPAAYVSATIPERMALRVASIYVPNGQSPDSDKFAYKMRFLERLAIHAKTLLEYDELLILGGDYNIAPADIDVWDAKKLRGSTCFHPDEQRHFRVLEQLGLIDIYRASHPETQAYSWWDYRGGSWEHNHGMRIDHLMASPRTADCIREAGMDDGPRAKSKASDHIPVWCTL
ncbi:MAG: exodeoxyribonuclease III [Hyphomicrobiales bacterium]|nr:exodeoxyribonuclease III [Hyphomicrobiales bacterium]